MPQPLKGPMNEGPRGIVGCLRPQLSVKHFHLPDRPEMSPTADSRGSAEPRLPQSLDKLPLVERKYPVDAGVEITRHDVEHLCKVWAEVGRAILMRRRAAP